MNEEINKTVNEFSARLREVFEDDLFAVILYGSAATSAYQTGVSDINVLVILENLKAIKMFKLGKEVKSLLRKNRISPFIMTHEEFTTASDVFPLEYCDILDSNELVYGNGDILSINVNMANLRTELEGKLRGAVNDLRSILMATEGNEKTLGKLILSWSGIGNILLRGLLRLKKVNVNCLDNRAIIAEVEKQYGVVLEAFSVLNQHRQSNKPFVPTASAFAETLLEPLKALVRAVDAMDGGSE